MRDKNIYNVLKKLCVRKRLVNKSLKAAYFFSFFVINTITPKYRK